jgi:hypothetical protein
MEDREIEKFCCLGESDTTSELNVISEGKLELVLSENVADWPPLTPNRMLRLLKVPLRRFG